MSPISASSVRPSSSATPGDGDQERLAGTGLAFADDGR
jgi:hypothetical protein